MDWDLEYRHEDLVEHLPDCIWKGGGTLAWVRGIPSARFEQSQEYEAPSYALAREGQVQDLVIEGNADTQIAAAPRLSEKAIAAHRSRMIRKMQATNAADLIRMMLGTRSV